MKCRGCGNSFDSSDVNPWSIEHGTFLGLCYSCGRELAEDLVSKFVSIKKNKGYAEKRGNNNS